MSSLLSVGIDVGTSTTQVVFSRLLLRDRAARFTAPDIRITAAEAFYRGKIYETPLLDNVRIDAKALRALVEGEFRRAGISPGETDTGAVIITGESARKENAAAVLERLSSLAGDFVVATAGPDLESRIAGQGSGAQEESRRRRCRVANFDIGGGTTNIAIFDAGNLAGVGCYDIGGRLLRFTPEGALTYISPGAAQIARSLGLRFRAGEKPAADELSQLADMFARVLESAVNPEILSPFAAMLRTPNSSPLTPIPVDAVCFSGGVADCVYGARHGRFEFHDFGVILAQAVRGGGLFGYPVITPKETIRATVIGAGNYTTTLSGSTIRYTDGALFPIKNLPVFLLSPAQEEAAFSGTPCDLARPLRAFMQQADAAQVAIALIGKPSPGWQELQRMARALADAFFAAMAGTPLVILTRHDMGKALGQALLGVRGQGSGIRDAGIGDLIVLDGITAGEYQFIDIGRPVMGGCAVPVVMKTLVFPNAQL